MKSKNINPVHDDIVQGFQHYFLIGSILFSFYKSNILQSRIKSPDWDYTITFVILFFITLINVCAYDIFSWKDYRVISPVLFGSFFYLIVSNKEIIRKVLILNSAAIVMLFFLPSLTSHKFGADRHKRIPDMPLLNSIIILQIQHPNLKIQF